MLGDGAQDDLVAERLGGCVDSLGQVGMKRVIEHEGDADEPRLPAGEQAGPRVRPIAEIGRDLQDALTRRLTRTGYAAHHYGDQRPRNSGARGDVLQRRRP